MLEKYLSFLVCPVTRSELTLHKLSVKTKVFRQGEKEIIDEGILFSGKDWLYPMIDGIAGLLVESFVDYGGFLKKNLVDYDKRKGHLVTNYPDLIQQTIKKNKRTKKSFEMEWGMFNYEEDRTWELKGEDQEMMIAIMDWFSPEFRWTHTPEEQQIGSPKKSQGNKSDSY